MDERQRELGRPVVVTSSRKPIVTRARQILVDGRGSITNIDEQTTIRRLVIVVSKRGSVRGNHFHRKAGHHVYLLSGKLRLIAKVRNKIIKKTLKPGFLVWIPPLVPHAFVALEESQALEFSHARFSSRDAQKLDEPLA